MFENYKVFNYTLAGRPLVIETGKISQLSNGSCLVRYDLSGDKPEATLIAYSPWD